MDNHVLELANKEIDRLREIEEKYKILSQLAIDWRDVFRVSVPKKGFEGYWKNAYVNVLKGTDIVFGTEVAEEIKQEWEEGGHNVP